LSAWAAWWATVEEEGEDDELMRFLSPSNALG